MNSALSWFWLMFGATLESVCIMLWCILFGMDGLTSSMFSWLLVSAVGHVCVLGMSVCIWNYLDTKRRRARQAMKPFLWAKKRKKPYTEAGIKRLGCARCGKPAQYQWQICSDGNNYRPICLECDIELNRAVLEFFGHHEKDRLMTEYEKTKGDSK